MRLANSLSYRVQRFAQQKRDRKDHEFYLKSERRPFAAGYHLHKWDVIQNALADALLLETFKRNGPLPQNYGLRLDERVVEYPWLMSRLSSVAETILDAGSVLNFEPLINLPLLKAKTLHIVTLGPEANCFWKRGVSYTFADLRNLPLRSNFYDQIVCISTLEHVGTNTEIYTSERVEQLQRDDYMTAACELWRVLAPGGRLFLTVPFGQPCNLDWLQQFDAAMIKKLIDVLQAREASVVYYKYEPTGWNVSSEEACRSCSYTDPTRWTAGDGDELPDTNTPAAAGAVACLDLLK